MKKHILLIHQVFVTPEFGGGTRHYELSKYLIQLGHRVTVIASNIDYLSGEKKPVSEETIDGINIKYAQTYSALHKGIFNRALAFISFAFSSFKLGKNTKDIDIIWGTSPPLFQSFTGLLLAKFKKVPFVFEVRDLWIDFARELNLVNNPLVITIFKWLEKQLYKSADHLIVNSPGFIPHINNIVPEKSITLFANGVISEEFENLNKDKTLQINKATFNPKHEFKVLYTGNIGIANDIETIIASAKNLIQYPDIAFYIIGGGIKFNEFKDYCKKNNITNIYFKKSIPKKEIPYVITECDICIASLKDIPLFGTVFPNKVFDYMAAGKPTILSINGVIKDVIERSKGGKAISPEDSNEMTSAILNYYNNRALIKTDGQHAKEYVKNKFERKKIANDLSDYFNNIGRKK